MQQAAWTSELREYFFHKAALDPVTPILEVGCGTAAVLSEHEESHPCFGVDLNFQYLEKAKRISHLSPLVCADGYFLPFPAGFFSLVYCHYLLLWIARPKVLIDEMIRVTKPKGYVAIFAEPDYAGSAPPDTLEEKVRTVQREALSGQGANPCIGSQIQGLLNESLLVDLECGSYGTCMPGFSKSGQKVEHRVFLSDLGRQAPNARQLSRTHLQKLRKGKLPAVTLTYFAFGQKPG